MAESDAQERTEEPTAKRLSDAREKGQIARSREMNTMLILLAGGVGMMMMGSYLVSGVADIMSGIFQITRTEIFDTNSPMNLFAKAIADSVGVLTPLFILLFIVALVAPMLLGGFSFSPQSIAFKWEKLDPIKGMGKLFAMRSLMELAKALGKFLLIGSVASGVLWFYFEDFLVIGNQDIKPALAQTMDILGWSFIFISASLIVIAAIDVPFQLWDHSRQLKMTKQEVKDEYKQTDGSPEVKSRARQLQREMAERRMMAEVPKADVVITNPTHYAIALRYDQARMDAPVVVAKGADLVAAKIREIANANDIAIVSSPVLARAIYFTTEINKMIPESLYLAVAQVLAYVFQLRGRRRKGHINDKPINMSDVPVPEDFRYDEEQE
ncbi:MAG: flagellar biosynthesis protein FlhB [Gammaproteobacteria bacterium]|nr:flagellar biosynthesis protein FlhB [Gammaproteobacteria bacterium]MDH5594177.1 flagellar biosynthesis protein FlhB [Gammaproteobacteria bacterium]MDH5614136.1 flagellar biosynthesis protein FlhB [Gammaproteobacteria bacterium]